MHEMVKGANVALSELGEDAESVRLGLSWVSESGDDDADVSVLLLNEHGKVRTDADFFFYNNPAAADGSVQLLGKVPTDGATEDRITLDLSAMPTDVERITVAASRHGGAVFGELRDLCLTVADRNGEELLNFSIRDAGVERAFVFGEFYRRNGEWKFRAVGQGYQSGLAGLATDFGIEVDEDEDTETDADDVPEQASAAPSQGDAGPPGVRPDAEETTTSIPAQVIPAPAAPARAKPEGAASTPTEPTGPSGVRRRPRTARKKVTLPKVAKPSLAENDNWRQSRLFPVTNLRNDRERETRATSVLLSVMAQVPEFGRRIVAAFGAPAGKMETFAEVSLPHGDNPKRPDGVIRIERAGKLWTALIETKTNGNSLKSPQVQDYMDIATRRSYEAVITLSNDVALEGSPLVDVSIDRRRKHKVGLWHLSWAEVAHQAQMLIRHEGLNNAVHAWLLQELLYYLHHENSGCHGFQNMGPAWVPVRNGIEEETLSPDDTRAVQVVESWERLIRQVSLRLGGELGQKVLPARRGKSMEPQARRAALAERLCEDGRLYAELRIEGAVGVLAITADLRTSKLRTSLDIPAPEQGYPLTWAKRLVKQLFDAPADVHIETLTDGPGSGPRGTLERLRPEPGDILPKGGDQITGFRLSLFKGMGNTRGNAESSFIRSVDNAVDRFCSSVVIPLERRPLARSRRKPTNTPA